MLESSEPRARTRGRPRLTQPTERVRDRVLSATRELLREHGFGRLTVDAIVERSGVSKATVYRWWPNRAAVAMDTLLEAAGPSTPRLHAGSALDNLRSHIRIASGFIGGDTGATLAGVVADLQHDPELAMAFRERYLAERRRLTRTLVEQAVAEGDLRPDADPELVTDALIGPMYYRRLLGHAPVTVELADALVDQLLVGLAPDPPVSGARDPR